MTLDFGSVPADGIIQTYARFRLAVDPAAAEPTGAATDGEVEDYVVSVTTEPAAVDLASFTAELSGDAVTVRWATTSELDTAGYQLYRSTDANRANAKEYRSRERPKWLRDSNRGWSPASARRGNGSRPVSGRDSVQRQLLQRQPKEFRRRQSDRFESVV